MSNPVSNYLRIARCEIELAQSRCKQAKLDERQASDSFASAGTHHLHMCAVLKSPELHEGSTLFELSGALDKDVKADAAAVQETHVKASSSPRSTARGPLPIPPSGHGSAQLGVGSEHLQPHPSPGHLRFEGCPPSGRTEPLWAPETSESSMPGHDVLELAERQAYEILLSTHESHERAQERLDDAIKALEHAWAVHEVYLTASQELQSTASDGSPSYQPGAVRAVHQLSPIDAPLFHFRPIVPNQQHPACFSPFVDYLPSPEVRARNPPSSAYTNPFLDSPMEECDAFHLAKMRAMQREVYDYYSSLPY